ncbi:DUF3592 domain-containing protein [Agarivorans sp. 1_MG-2023]|uniref:DUF3592 domain-containing protein n=1 Tax=Agarivorans sp. 1_MG-2023 TaxID=3062634 RepID=UPI0026E25C6D|nr:DUF3592 domain-containing protein [Agarivorans sp. 1_MG-2023]MDO6764483.1 hypothetical protein [Agarivorans sp. 1_MG-2023]
MNATQRQGSLKQLGKKAAMLFWLVSACLAYLTGHLFASNYSYINYSQVLTAEVTQKSSYTSNTSSSSQSRALHLNIIYQFENPSVAGKLERELELAPLVYGQMRQGDAIAIYYNPAMSPKSRIAHPVQVWFTTVLSLVIFMFSVLVSFIVTKHSVLDQQGSKKFAYWMLLILCSPIAVNQLLMKQHNKQLASELASEQSWPSWPEFEEAVPKPAWWSEVPIKYFDPMSYTSEEYQSYVEQNKGSDKHLRRFKVAYVFMLLHQDDPLQQGWDLARGTTREFMPLYEFFLEHYMTSQWDGDCYSNVCNDATQMVEMAGDLISMKLDENQVESSQVIAENIMQYKYARGNNRGKYYFLSSYRRLLEHTHDQAYAQEILSGLVSECLVEAQGLNNPSLLRKWQKFWTTSQREVGMFSS